MAMSRKHYRAFAAAIADEHALHAGNYTVQLALDSVTREIAVICKRDNGEFSLSRFYDAAGFNPDRPRTAQATRFGG